MLGEELRRALANHSNAETVDHSLQRQLLRGFDLIENILRGFIAHALQAEQVGFRQFVDVGDILHQAALGKLVY